MHTVNFKGLAQASAASIVWPFLNGDTEPPTPFASIDGAKVTITPANITMTLGNGLVFDNSAIIATIDNARAANMVGNQYYELWIRVGADNLALVRGTMEFTATKVRI